MFSSVGVMGLASAAVFARPSTAVAGYLNKDTLPEVLAPNAAAVDRDILKTGKVQDGLKDVAFFANVAKEVSRWLSLPLLMSSLRVLHEWISSCTFVNPTDGEAAGSKHPN
jgi:hypothetical protein